MSTRTVPLAEFLTRFAPADHEHTWPITLELLAEGADGDQVRTLMVEYEARGGFEQPIWIDPGGCDPADVHAGECTGEPDCCPPRVRNGMHRIAALARLGVETITFTDTCPGSDDSGRGLEVHLHGVTDPQDALGEESNPFAVFSFRLDENTWIQTDFLEGEPPRVKILFFDHLDLAADIVAALPARLATFGITVERITTEILDLRA